MDEPRQPPVRPRRASSWLCVLSAVGIFALFAPSSHWLTYDSGPYLAMARNLLETGRPDSNFGFFGNVSELPAPPNFAPPGFSFLLAAARLVAPSELAAAGIVLCASLVALLLGVSAAVRRATGDAWFALGTAVVVGCQPQVHDWAAMVLTELPFLALAVWACHLGASVLRGEASRTVSWLVLPLLSASLVLVRYLGISFSLAFGLLFLVSSRPARRRFEYFAAFQAITCLPILAWWAYVAASSPPSFFPARPSSLLGPPTAAAQVLTYLVVWLGPWLMLVGALAWIGRDAERQPQAADDGGHEARCFAVAALAYLVLLVLLRTRHAYFPLEAIGWRYMAPAWPLLAVAMAIWLHRRLARTTGRRRSRLALVLVAVTALAMTALGLQRHGDTDQRPLFPTASRTFAFAKRQLPAAATVLCNACQPLSVEREDLLVVAIPSRYDFVYSMDLGAAARTLGVRWLVLFDQQHGPDLYDAPFRRWIDRGPSAEDGVRVVRGRRLPDGAVYEVEPLGDLP